MPSREEVLGGTGKACKDPTEGVMMFVLQNREWMLSQSEQLRPRWASHVLTINPGHGKHLTNNLCTATPMDAISDLA